jgi:hypothetical protein
MISPCTVFLHSWFPLIFNACGTGTTFLFDELVKRHPNIKSREIKEPGRINDVKEAHASFKLTKN